MNPGPDQPGFFFVRARPDPGERPIISRLKPLLRRFKPVYGPLWRPLRPYFVGSSPVRRRPLVVRARIVGEVVLRGLLRRPRPIRPLAGPEFNALAKRYPYYKGRSKYMAVACAIAGDLIDTHRGRTALELGAHLQPIIVGADVMGLDTPAEPTPQVAGRRIVHDATQTPWPIADKTYDVFVALQVFEHLGTSQNAAFREVCRVARHAIISLPIDWEMPDPTNIHHRLSSGTVLSWFAPLVPTRIDLGNGGPKKRLIYVFENLPTDAGGPPR